MTALILFAASLAGGFLFPWWWPAVAAYAVGFWRPRSAFSAFISGFGGTALAWGGLAAFLDQRNHHLLSGRMADLFHLPGGWALVPATGLIGGLMGGLGALAGQTLRAYVKPFPPKPPKAPKAGAEAATEGAVPESGTASESVPGPDSAP
jgi:hypothetical protein